ncbi:TIGR02302 family protein [Marinivivus vitaminiproducens]|uniref:TIGR02302 family protein n=1 Tax=Marinivivus vitaminiproducens TaxID=3035935 RepID=UPI00279F1505|nr:TIGR02302 family protein [Geminicoccaceae bacterium SCSIO 64248]
MAPDDPRRAWSFRLRLFLARFSAFWERAWPAAWPSLAVVAAFVTLSLLEAWSYMPGWLHLIGLLAFALILGAAIVRGLPAFVWSSADDALRRLEEKGGLSHRPLRGLADSLGVGGSDDGSQALWQVHRKRLVAAIGRARVGWPRSELVVRDPRGLRAIAVLAVLVTVVGAGADGPRRIKQAFLPSFAQADAGQPLEATLWVTPPSYTNRPAVVLENEPAPQLDADGNLPPAKVHLVPAGSTVLAQVHHAGVPAGQLTLGFGDRSQNMTATGEASAEAELEVVDSGRVSVMTSAGEVAGWTLQAAPDRAPLVRFDEPPSASQRAALRLPFHAEDDYGVVSVTLLLARTGAGEMPERFDLRAEGRPETPLQGAPYLDLTPHRFAGLPVTLRLEARDGMGQIGLSDPIETVLPERQFQNPVARFLVEQRKQLAIDGERRDEVADLLNGLSQSEIARELDATTQLALRSIMNRLALGEDQKSLDEAMDLLWDTALHLEDGALSLAERRLRDAQERVQEALENEAPDQELEQLMQELQEAMNEFLQAMAQMAGQQPNDMQLPQQNPNAQTVTPQDLAQMLEQAREMLRSGSREAAQQMLADLQRMLENLRPMENNQAGQQGQNALNELQDLANQQQELLDRSFDMNRQAESGDMSMEPGEQGEQQASQAGRDQEALRRQLGEMMRQLGESGMEIPRALGEAEMAMRDAEQALQQGAPGAAVESQSQALDALRQGGQAVAEAMAQQYGQGMAGQPGQAPGMANPNGRDPLGRSPRNNGGVDSQGTNVPDEMDMGRARAILEELYRRAADRSRPPVELDYIDRLLRRF